MAAVGTTQTPSFRGDLMHYTGRIVRAQWAEHVTHGKESPFSTKANSGRQPGVSASQIHTNYQHCGLFTLTLCRASWEKISVITSGQREIFVQFKASDPNVGAEGLEGAEVITKGIQDPASCHHSTFEWPLWEVSIFLSDPKLFGDGFSGESLNRMGYRGAVSAEPKSEAEKMKTRL